MIGKRISGRRFDTAKAEKLVEWELGVRPNTYARETLYRKRTGEYFLHGLGGAQTRYAKSTESGVRCAGEDIIPITADEAKELVAEHLGAGFVERIFPVKEETDKASFTVSVTDGVWQAGKRRSASLGMSMSAWVEALISTACKEG